MESQNQPNTLGCDFGQGRGADQGPAPLRSVELVGARHGEVTLPQNYQQQDKIGQTMLTIRFIRLYLA